MKKPVKELTLEDLASIRGAAEATEVSPECPEETEGLFSKKATNHKNVGGSWKRARC